MPASPSRWGARPRASTSPSPRACSCSRPRGSVARGPDRQVLSGGPYPELDTSPTPPVGRGRRADGIGVKSGMMPPERVALATTNPQLGRGPRPRQVAAAPDLLLQPRRDLD